MGSRRRLCCATSCIVKGMFVLATVGRWIISCSKGACWHGSSCFRLPPVAFCTAAPDAYGLHAVAGTPFSTITKEEVHERHEAAHSEGHGRYMPCTSA